MIARLARAAVSLLGIVGTLVVLGGVLTGTAPAVVLGIGTIVLALVLASVAGRWSA